MGRLRHRRRTGHINAGTPVLSALGVPPDSIAAAPAERARCAWTMRNGSGCFVRNSPTRTTTRLCHRGAVRRWVGFDKLRVPERYRAISVAIQLVVEAFTQLRYGICRR